MSEVHGTSAGVDLNWIVDAPFEQLPSGSPDTTALSIDAERSWTYRELRDARDGIVGALRERGVSRGDRVGLLMMNSLDYVAAYFAIARLGAIAVRLNFRLTAPELEYILRDSGCSVVVVHTSRLTQVEPVRESSGVRAWVSVEDDAEIPAPDWAPVLAPRRDTDVANLARPAGSDVLMLMYTSGTTGRPKGVVWTHDNAMWLASMQVMKYNYDSRVVAMTTGPLYHAGAFELLLLPALLSHGTAVLMSSGGMDTDRIVRTIRAAEVTHVLLYPFLLYALLEDETLDTRALASLDAVMVGGDPVLPWAIEAVDRTLPGVRIQQGYGLTEATMSTCLDHEHAVSHPDSVGRPMPLAQVRTVRADGVPCQRDEVGEVWIRSPAVAAGYWQNPEATASTFVDGWCRTGDLGRITSDGFLVLTGREKDMIRSGGENIYPAEVESVLVGHDAVRTVAVVAVPDQKFLEVGLAVVVRDSDAVIDDVTLEAELRVRARALLAGYKGPRHYTFVDELPINASGKVLKARLRDSYSDLGTVPHASVPAPNPEGETS